MKFNKCLMMALAVFVSLVFACGDDSPTSIDDPTDNGNDDVESIFYGLTVDVEGGETFTFVVDLSDLEGFDPDEFQVFAAGEFGEGNTWQEPGTAEDLELTLMDDAEDFPASSGVVIPEGSMEYKYFSTFVDEGWEGGEWAGEPNRSVTIESGQSVLDEWGDQPAE